MVFVINRQFQKIFLIVKRLQWIRGAGNLWNTCHICSIDLIRYVNIDRLKKAREEINIVFTFFVTLLHNITYKIEIKCTEDITNAVIHSFCCWEKWTEAGDCRQEEKKICTKLMVLQKTCSSGKQLSWFSSRLVLNQRFACLNPTACNILFLYPLITILHLKFWFFLLKATVLVI